VRTRETRFPSAGERDGTHHFGAAAARANGLKGVAEVLRHGLDQAF
jgi:hypothetical protein